MGRRARNLAILLPLALLGGLAAWGLWWTLHRAGGAAGLATGQGYDGLERSESAAESGVRLRSD